jgi:hypothetical protein
MHRSGPGFILRDTDQLLDICDRKAGLPPFQKQPDFSRSIVRFYFPMSQRYCAPSKRIFSTPE